MKTIGEVLTKARHDHALALEKLSEITKIDIRFIEALEKNDFNSLPSATFAKGFIRNLSQALGKDPDEMIAIFRRDYHYSSLKPAITPVRTRKLNFSKFFNYQYLAVFLGVFVFLIYLVFQYRAVITPPKLVVDSPTNGAVLTSPIILEGQTDSGATISINDSLKITPESDGKFTTKLDLPPGQGTIKVTSTSRFSRTSSKTLNLTILSQ